MTDMTGENMNTPESTATGRLVWVMGPTASGKTTLCARVAGRLRREGRCVLHFDGDEVRGFFGPGHGFSADDRLRVVRTLVHLAGKASRAGINVLVSALTASPEARTWVDRHLPERFLVYLECDIDECASRDPKGLYARARRGDIDTLVGYNTPYTPPAAPDMILPTAGRPVDHCAAALYDAMVSERPAGVQRTAAKPMETRS